MLYEDVEPFRSGSSVGIGTGPGGGVYISTRQTPPSYFLESVVTVETTTTTNYYFSHDGYYGRRAGSAGAGGGGGLINNYRGGSCHNLQVPKVTTPQQLSWSYLNTNDFLNDDFFHHHRSASHNSNPTKHFQRQRSRSLATAVVPPLLLGTGALDRNSRHGHSARRSKTPSPKRYVSTSPRSLSPKYNGSRSPSNRSRRSSNTSLGSTDHAPSTGNGTKVSPSRVVRQRERAGSMPGHQHYDGGRSPLGSANVAGGRRLSLLTTTKPTINHLIHNSSSDDSSSSEGGLLRRKLTKKPTYHVVIIGGANVGKSTLTSYFLENNSKMNSPTAAALGAGAGEANSPGTSSTAAATTTEATSHALKRQDYFGLMNGSSTQTQQQQLRSNKPNLLQHNSSNNNNFILKVSNDPNGQDHLYKYDAIILLYSVTDWQSFEYCKDIIQNSNMGTRTVVLVGNKSDLERSRLVTTEDGLNLASSLQSCKFIEISCTLGLNISELIKGLCTQIQLRSSASCSRSPSPNTSSSSTNTNINGSYYLGGSSSSGISSGSSSLSSSSVLKTSRKMIDKILNRVLNRKWKSCLDFHNL